jgi:hypothetical protein
MMMDLVETLSGLISKFIDVALDRTKTHKDQLAKTINQLYPIRAALTEWYIRVSEDDDSPINFENTLDCYVAFLNAMNEVNNIVDWGSLPSEIRSALLDILDEIATELLYIDTTDWLPEPSDTDDLIDRGKNLYLKLDEIVMS